MKDGTKDQQFFPAWQAAAHLRCATRTIQHRGQQWERNARTTGDPYLPSSPKNGLRRSWYKVNESAYSFEDLAEFIENSVRERIGQPLVSWRREKEQAHD